MRSERTMALSPDKHLDAGLSRTLWSRRVRLHTNGKHCHSPSDSQAFDVLFTEIEVREVEEWMAAQRVHKGEMGGEHEEMGEGAC